MTFESLVEAVDERVRAASRAGYGFYRGPHVAYWHFGDRSARLRAGANGDVLLDGAIDPPVHAPCDDAAVETLSSAIVTMA